MNSARTNRREDCLITGERGKNGGRERDRTDDPHNAIVVLYQLSYAPPNFEVPIIATRIRHLQASQPSL